MQPASTIAFETLFSFAPVVARIRVASGRLFAGNQARAVGVGFVVPAGGSGRLRRRRTRVRAAFNPAVTLARATMDMAERTDV